MVVGWGPLVCVWRLIDGWVACLQTGDFAVRKAAQGDALRQGGKKSRRRDDPDDNGDWVARVESVLLGILFPSTDDEDAGADTAAKLH